VKSVRQSNPFHYLALLLALANLLQFLIFNYRGIVSWSGVGVYVTVSYVVAFVLCAAVWVIAQVRSRSELGLLFWLLMAFPVIFLVLLPEKFFV
jgi:hypothetical protein